MTVFVTIPYPMAAMSAAEVWTELACKVRGIITATKTTPAAKGSNIPVATRVRNAVSSKKKIIPIRNGSESCRKIVSKFFFQRFLSVMFSRNLCSDKSSPARPS